MPQTTISARIKDLRQNARLSMQAVAQAIGVSSWQTVQQWEKGSTAPARKHLEKLARALNTTPEYILFGRPGDTTGKSKAYPIPPEILDQIVADLITLPEADRDIWITELHLARLRYSKGREPPEHPNQKLSRSA